MNFSQYKHSQLKLLCKDIQSNPKFVKLICENLDKFYYEWSTKKIDSKTLEVKKYKDGTEKIRTITPSLNSLKEIQRNIKKYILEPIELPDEIHGGAKKRSNITNAKPHQGNKFQFTTDLKSFFPSITHKRVYDTFISLGFSNHYSHWLTKLTTWKYKLPQGAPTSTHIANLVFLEADYKLISFCNENGLVYTRYVDDLTFSSQVCFKSKLQNILDIVMQSDFKISWRKTFYQGYQNITGVNVFNNFIDGPEKIIEKAKCEIKNNSDFKPYSSYLERIRRTNKKKASH